MGPVEKGPGALIKRGKATLTAPSYTLRRSAALVIATVANAQVRCSAVQRSAMQSRYFRITTPVQGTGTCLHPTCLPMVMVIEEQLFLLAISS